VIFTTAVEEEEEEEEGRWSFDFGGDGRPLPQIGHAIEADVLSNVKGCEKRRSPIS